MDKPFTIKIQELQEKIIKNINEAELPAFNVRLILQDICKTIEDLDKQEIEKYNIEKKDKTIKEGK